MLIGKWHAYVYGLECNDSSSTRLQDIPVCPYENTLSADSDNLDISAACNAISFFYPACGRSLHPSDSKLSCSVCTDPGSPPSAQCQMQITQADSAVLILPYPSCFPIHSLLLTDYTAAESTGLQRIPHECALTVTVMCHISAARTLHYITASNLSMNTSMRQRLWIGVRDYTGGLLNSRVTERFTRSELHSPLIELFEFLGDSCLKCIVTHLCKQHFYI